MSVSAGDAGRYARGVLRAVLVACLAAALVVSEALRRRAASPGRSTPRVVADTTDGKRRASSSSCADRRTSGAATTLRRAGRRRVSWRVAALRRAAAAQTGVRSALRELGVLVPAVLGRQRDRGEGRPARARGARKPRRRGGHRARPRVRRRHGRDRRRRPPLHRAAWSGTCSGSAPPRCGRSASPAKGSCTRTPTRACSWDVPTLKRQYRGWDGTTANHAYSWWDAVHDDLDGDGVNPCGFSLREPCDDNADDGSHGTHTMGTAVGDDGAGNQVGVAPGARWIACRNMDEGVGRPSTYIECLQFFLAPTDLDGLNPDPARRPHVVGNSYACPPDEGCSIGSLQAAVDNLRAAGVFMAVAAGNEGEFGCGSVLYPPAVYDSVVSVGATDMSDQIAFFSSRGPVQVDGSGRLKPDLAAPGVSIRSATAAGYGSPERDVHGGAARRRRGVAPLVGAAAAARQRRRDRAAAEGHRRSHAPRRTAAAATRRPRRRTTPTAYGRIDVAAAYGSTTAPATLAAADATVTEGNTGRRPARFTVTVSRASAQAITVAYAAEPRTAAAGSDFVAVSGKLTFARRPALEDRRRAGARRPAGRARRDLPARGSRAPRMRGSGAPWLSAGSATTTSTGRSRCSRGSRSRRLPLTAGRSGRLGYTVSEAASIVCTIERRASSAWLRVRSLSIRARAGAHVALLPAASLRSGRYRVSCVPTDVARQRRATGCRGVRRRLTAQRGRRRPSRRGQLATNRLTGSGVRPWSIAASRRTSASRMSVPPR